MRIEVWRNLNTKKWEATPVKAGRPIKQNVKERKSRRDIATGDTQDEAVKNLLNQVGFVPAKILPTIAQPDKV